MTRGGLQRSPLRSIRSRDARTRTHLVVGVSVGCLGHRLLRSVPLLLRRGLRRRVAAAPRRCGRRLRATGDARCHFRRRVPHGGGALLCDGLC